MSIVIDSYSESNQDADAILRNYVRGQSFENSSGLVDLEKISVYLKKVGSATGDMTLYLYEHSGTYGSSSVYTGTPLATSTSIDASELSSSYGLVDFVFPTYELANDYYVWLLLYDNGGADDYIQLGSDTSSPTHSGNICFGTIGGTVQYRSGSDYIFYVYGDESFNPTSIVEVGSSYAIPPFKSSV